MSDQPTRPRYGYWCISRCHVWTERHDAERCCNGWHRELVIGPLPYGEKMESINDYAALHDFDVQPAGKLWVRDEPGKAYWWGTGREHSNYEAVPA